MSLLQVQKELFNYAANQEFVSDAIFEKFERKFDEAGGDKHGVHSSLFLKKFRPNECPNCKATGYFKRHIFGKLIHPECSTSWYVSPGEYILMQLGDVMRVGAKRALDYSEETKPAGCLITLFHYLLGVVRLILSIPFMIVQAIISLSQQKKKKEQ